MDAFKLIPLIVAVNLSPLTIGQTYPQAANLSLVGKRSMDKNRGIKYPWSHGDPIVFKFNAVENQGNGIFKLTIAAKYKKASDSTNDSEFVLFAMPVLFQASDSATGSLAYKFDTSVLNINDSLDGASTRRNFLMGMVSDQWAYFAVYLKASTGCSVMFQANFSSARSELYNPQVQSNWSLKFDPSNFPLLNHLYVVSNRHHVKHKK